jgi:hypothetical protein
MPSIDTVIVRKGDAPPWSDVGSDRFGPVFHPDPEQSWKVAVLEEGMGSGLPSVALRFDLPDGTTMIAETSLAIWSSVTIMARGAFPEAFAGGPLDPSGR